MPGRLVLSLLSATFRFRGEVRFEPPTRLGEFSDSIDWEASQADRINLVLPPVCAGVENDPVIMLRKFAAQACVLRDEGLSFSKLFGIKVLQLFAIFRLRRKNFANGIEGISGRLGTQLARANPLPYSKPVQIGMNICQTNTKPWNKESLRSN